MICLLPKEYEQYDYKAIPPMRGFQTIDPNNNILNIITRTSNPETTLLAALDFFVVVALALAVPDELGFVVAVPVVILFTPPAGTTTTLSVVVVDDAAKFLTASEI